MAELAESIRARGLLQPIVVKREGDGYVIMAGERRWRAAQMAGLETIPALVRDDDPLEIAMIENLQRQNLTPLEEAEGLGQLIEQFSYTHETLAEMLGKSRPYVSNTLALRRLPEEIKAQYHATPDVSREILIHIAREERPERQLLLWRLARLRKLAGEVPRRGGWRERRSRRVARSGAPGSSARAPATRHRPRNDHWRRPPPSGTSSESSTGATRSRHQSPPGPRRRHVRPTDRDTAPGASLSLRSAL